MISLGRQRPELFAHWQTPLALKMAVFVYFVFSLNHISSPPILAASALTVTVTNSSDADRETKPVTARSSRYPIAATSHLTMAFCLLPPLVAVEQMQDVFYVFTACF